jgi:hypothetical protein
MNHAVKGFRFGIFCCKFGSMEELERWAWDSEIGSPLFTAALRGLVWELVVEVLLFHSSQFSINHRFTNIKMVTYVIDSIRMRASIFLVQMELSVGQGGCTSKSPMSPGGWHSRNRCSSAWLPIETMLCTLHKLVYRECNHLHD